VTNLRNGRKVVVRINDRGPFVGDRIIDLSYTAAAKLDMLTAGTAPVEVRVISMTAGPGSAQPPVLPTAPVPGPIVNPPPPPATAPPEPQVTVVNAPAARAPDAQVMFIQAGVFADHENARRRVETLLAGGIELASLDELSGRIHDWLRARPASHERDLLLREVMWSGTTEEKFQVYNELTPSAKPEAVWYLVQSALRTGEGSIESWIKTQPSGAARKAALGMLASFQTDNTPERIDALVEEWPAGPDRDAVLQGIASSLSGNDAHRALDFARRVSSPDVRQAAFENIAYSWRYRDAPAARAWIVSAPELSAEEKRVLLRQFDDW